MLSEGVPFETLITTQFLEVILFLHFLPKIQFSQLALNSKNSATNLFLMINISLVKMVDKE